MSFGLRFCRVVMASWLLVFPLSGVGSDAAEDGWGFDLEIFGYLPIIELELEDGSKSSQVRQSLRLGCASSFPIVVPYCQHVSRPPFWGCSLACGFYYSLEEERCVKRELKTEL